MAITAARRDKLKKRVLLVTGVFPPGIGGMQKYYYHLCRNTGHRMTVLAPIYGGDETFDRGQAYKVIRRRFLQQDHTDFQLAKITLSHHSNDSDGEDRCNDLRVHSNRSDWADPTIVL